MAISPLVVTEKPAEGALTAAVFERLERATETPAFRLAQNAVTQVTAEDVALNRSIVFTRPLLLQCSR